MVSLPREFVATKVPGYFWNTKTKTLFSIKLYGELRELKKCRPGYWNKEFHNFNGYRVSHKGKRRKLYLDYLMELEEVDSEIKIFNRKYAI